MLKPERSNLAIREDKKRGVFVEGLSEWVVRSPAEIYGLMERGAIQRRVSGMWGGGWGVSNILPSFPILWSTSSFAFANSFLIHKSNQMRVIDCAFMFFFCDCLFIDNTTTLGGQHEHEREEQPQPRGVYHHCRAVSHHVKSRRRIWMVYLILIV